VNELVFPVIGSLAVVVLLLPAAAIFAKAVLWMLRHVSTAGVLHGLGTRALVLVASSAVPLVWLISAGVHQAETGRSALACVFPHPGADECAESALFALILVTFVAITVVPMVLREWLAVRRARQRIDLRLTARLEVLIDRTPALLALKRRTIGITGSGTAIATHGLLRPVVIVDAGLAVSLDDIALTAALCHELEHVAGRDPFRYFLVSLALALNPFGKWLLASELGRWIVSREVHCDRAAVLAGADPAALAHALVVAARPGPTLSANLGPSETASLKLRVDLLLAYAERPPKLCCGKNGSRLGMVVVLAVTAAILPHHFGTHALDVLHSGAEHAVVHITGGP